MFITGNRGHMIKKQGCTLVSMLFFSCAVMLPLCGAKSGPSKDKQRHYVAEQGLVNQDVSPENVNKSKEHVEKWLNQSDRKDNEGKACSSSEFLPLGDGEISRERRSGSFSVPISGAVTPTLPGAILEEGTTDADVNKNLVLTVKVLGDEVAKLREAVESSSYAGLDSASQDVPSLADQVAQLNEKLIRTASQFETQQKLIATLQEKLDKVSLQYDEELVTKPQVSEKSSAGSVTEQKKVNSTKAPAKKNIPFWKRLSCCCGSCDDVKNGGSTGTVESQSSYSVTSPRTDQQSNSPSHRPGSFKP